MHISLKLSILFLCVSLVQSYTAMDSCSLNSGQLNFGDYSAVHPRAKKARTRIQVRCSGAGSYNISLSRGHGDYTRRKMSSTLDHLFYNIYTDASYTQIWGNGSGNTAVISGSYNSGNRRFSRQNHRIYGVLYPGQDAYPGVFTDDLYISFTF